MAARRKPSVKKVKFELTRSGIAGIGIVCFCVFLWMFLLGVWTGQSLLLPSSASRKNLVKVAGTLEQQSAALLHIEADTAKKVKKVQ